MTSGHPPPESRLIREHRERLGLSVREAARRAGISEGSWRRTEGPRDLTRTAVTIARMARAAGLTPADLEACGRGDAARELASLAAASTEQPDPLSELRILVRRVEELADQLEQQDRDRTQKGGSDGRRWRAG